MSTHFSRSLTGVVIAAILVVCRSGVAAEIRWSTDIEDTLSQASASNQLVLIEFTADWCVFCKKMEKTTFKDPQVAQRISRDFLAVRIDADKNKALVKDLGIKGLPAILVVSPDLKVVDRISGFQTPEALVPKLDAITAARMSQSRPPAIAGAQNPQRPPARSAPPQNAIERNTYGPAPGELQFEPLSQEEAPKVGMRRPSTPPRKQVPVEPHRGRSDQSVAQNTNPDSESFFKTISRERGSRDTTGSSPSFDGLCVVSAVDNRELVRGSASHQMNYKGRTLYFSSAENKDRFRVSPAVYWPMLDGLCPMTLLQDEEQVEGKLEFAAIYRKRIWLFTSSAGMQEFLQDPGDVAEEALQLAEELQR